MDVSTLLSSINTGLSALKFRGEQKQRFFQQVIDPLYVSLIASIKDYDSVLQELREQSEDAVRRTDLDNEAVRKMQKTVNKLRTAMYYDRRAVGSIAQTLSERPEVEIKSFGNRILEIFSFQSGYDSPITSDLGRLVDQIAFSTEDEYLKQLASHRDQIAHFQNHVRTKRPKLGIEHAALKLKAFS